MLENLKLAVAYYSWWMCQLAEYVHVVVDWQFRQVGDKVLFEKN